VSVRSEILCGRFYLQQGHGALVFRDMCSVCLTAVTVGKQYSHGRGLGFVGVAVWGRCCMSTTQPVSDSPEPLMRDHWRLIVSCVLSLWTAECLGRAAVGLVFRIALLVGRKNRHGIPRVAEDVRPAYPCFAYPSFPARTRDLLELAAVKAAAVLS